MAVVTVLQLCFCAEITEVSWLRKCVLDYVSEVNGYSLKNIVILSIETKPYFQNKKRSKKQQQNQQPASNPNFLEKQNKTKTQKTFEVTFCPTGRHDY